MIWTLVGSGVALSLSLMTVQGSVDFAPREHVLPERNDDPTLRAQAWVRSGDWRRSLAIRAHGASEGTRVAAAFSAYDDAAVTLQARGIRQDESGGCSEDSAAGPWVPMQTTFAGSELRVAVVDLGARFACAQVRMQEADDARVGDLQWELVEPRYPDAGRVSRQLSLAPPTPKAVAPELETIGLITREEWGARPTQCSTTEDDWYRMAIHHTAGPQTAGGTIEERLRGVQAYAMDSGGYCDIPYQMLVGYDGSLYEGRPLNLQSGATGGGNNPGNLAVCFIGCYHEPQSQCVGGVGDQPTDAMMQRGQLLVQTLANLHDISTAEDNIRGHRDWPGNSTACPGSLLHPRLGELRADLTWFSATEMDRSWADAELEVELGDETEVWIELQNTGGMTWVPGETFLAPTAPRDGASALRHSSWPSPNRAATVEAPVEPGAIGRFSFTVSPSSVETISQSFGLVHEGMTWFADAPWGGGPVDDAIVLTVVGVEPTEGGGGSSSGGDDETDTGIVGTSGDGLDTDGDDSGFSPALPPADGELDGGCGCTSEPRDRGIVGALWVLLLAGVRRRRGC